MSNDKSVLPVSWQGSTYLNSKVNSYEDLADRVRRLLGAPQIEVELTDSQIATFIDEAIEWFSQYHLERKYLVFSDANYEAGCGIKLDDIVRACDMKSECLLSSSSIEITGTNITHDPITDGDGNYVFSAMLSASPFFFPDPDNPSISALGQDIYLKFDKSNPWDSNRICNADCFTLKPRGSSCPILPDRIPYIDFSDLIYKYPELIWMLDDPIVGGSQTGILPTDEIPCNILEAIPSYYFPMSAFYPEPELVGFPVKACVTIRNGEGTIKPFCKPKKVKCKSMSAVWDISDDFEYVIDGDTISGEDGRVFPLSALDLSRANSVVIPGLPVCNIDGSISLNENTGLYATFYLCNSAIDTEGEWEVENAQFQISYYPPSNVFDKRFCDIKNKGFTISKFIDDPEDCIQNTGKWVPVDVVFETTEVESLTGEVVTYCSGGFDYELESRRKINSVFSMDYNPGTGGGYFGSNILFSFDYGVVANAFGYDLQGNRNLYRNGYDMLSYELARGFIDQVQRMVNYASFEFNPDTQYLTIIPEPFPLGKDPMRGTRFYVVGIYVEKPIKHLINKKWVQDWVLARSMETLGLIRSKFGNVTLYGGASIQGDSLVSMANSEKERLLKELRNDNYYSEPSMFFTG